MWIQSVRNIITGDFINPVYLCLNARTFEVWFAFNLPLHNSLLTGIDPGPSSTPAPSPPTYTTPRISKYIQEVNNAIL